MGEFSTELEILQDENFAIKAPVGFKGEDWKSRSGRPGRVLYSKYATDYISSECYITVSTIAMDPITDEIRKRIEAHLGEEGFDFEFLRANDRHVVFYYFEAEADYKTYHAFIVLNEKKTITMDVVFSGPYDNTRDIARNIITSLRANFKEDVTEEELAADAARLQAEATADAQKAAVKQAQLDAAHHEEAVQVAEMVEEVAEESVEEIAAEPVVEVVEESVKPEASVEDGAEESEIEQPLDAVEEELTEETAQIEPTFDDSDEGQHMRMIYNAIKEKERITLSELQTIPAFADLGRMGTTQILNKMMRDGVITRVEATDNIYFALPGYEESQKADAAEEAFAENELDPMEQYKIDYAKYKEELAAWKKSKDFFGRTEMEKPVEPVKPKKKR